MNHFGDNLVSFLKNAAVKLEELQVQTALGKKELSDKLEEIKKDARLKIHEMKLDLNSSVEDSKGTIQQMKAKMENFELQFALGKAETMDEIEKQKKKLEAVIQEFKKSFQKFNSV